MTKTEIERILSTWKERLLLQNWQIKVDWDDPLPDDVYASVERSDQYDNATISLTRRWSEWTKPEAEQHLVHELVHLLHRNIDMLQDPIEKLLHPDAWQLHDARYDYENEQFIDRLTTALIRMVG